MAKKSRDVKKLADRFGANCLNAAEPARLLRGCKCVNIPFVGSFAEVPFFLSENGGTANIINVNDKDLHVINLGIVVRDYREALQDKLRKTTFDGITLARAQKFCLKIEADQVGPRMLFDGENPSESVDTFLWAYHYFLTSWLTRGGKGGTKGEFKSGLSVRWKSGGGDSVVRFRSATEALTEWEKVMQLCTFHTMDALEFIDESKKDDRDIPENAWYVDADWPDVGSAYKHHIGSHEKLRDSLQSIKNGKVVVRYADHPLIRDLYRAPHWTWRYVTGRDQANNEKSEVLITNWE